MTLLRSARFPAILLLVSAAVGLLVANAPFGSAVVAAFQTHVAVPGTMFDLSWSHWISDGLLALFFLVVTVELRHELTKGQLASPRRAIQPALAAAGGVLVPIGVYLAITAGSGLERGWPIPTATDIAFALGVLAVFGRGLPSGIRVFLLAVAILDDLVGIILIAVLFAADVDIWWLTGALVLAVGIAALTRAEPARSERAVRALWWAAIAALSIGVWGLVWLSGVHATIAGVIVGLALAAGPAERARHGLEPAVNGIVLPLFAFTAALVVIPAVGVASLSPVFWGILVALPVGKIVGITLAGWLAQRFFHTEGPRLAGGDFLAVGALGGIGFTVSLLMAGLAFPDVPLIRDEAVLGVLAGSAVALVAAGVIVTSRARHHRRLGVATGAYQEEVA